MSKPDDVFLFLDHDVILQITIEYKRRLTVTFFRLRLLHRCVNMSKVTYPRPCPHCRKLLNSRFSYCRHKAHCGKTKAKVQCLYCEKSFNRLDNCKRHMKNVHSEVDLLQVDLLASGASLFWPRSVRPRATKSREVDLSRLQGFHSHFAPKMGSGVTRIWGFGFPLRVLDFNGGMC